MFADAGRAKCVAEWSPEASESVWIRPNQDTSTKKMRGKIKWVSGWARELASAVIIIEIQWFNVRCSAITMIDH